jgi:hypothetical protein
VDREIKEMFEKIAITPGRVFEAEERDFLGMAARINSEKNLRKS